LRTRAAIVAAGCELFESRGYDETTVADIAAAADIGTRTFFGYFSSKEELLFPESDSRIAAVGDAIAGRSFEDRPVDVLLAALLDVSLVSTELVGSGAALRLRLMQSVPAVRGRALQLQLIAQREIAAQLCDAYPELEPLEAAALVGAFVGAIGAALDSLLGAEDISAGDQHELFMRLRRVVETVLSRS
jgi:AcrR family transcriptional regulator